MLQALLASGALFQGLKAEMTARAERLGFMLACAVVVLTVTVASVTRSSLRSSPVTSSSIWKVRRKPQVSSGSVAASGAPKSPSATT